MIIKLPNAKVVTFIYEQTIVAESQCVPKEKSWEENRPSGNLLFCQLGHE